MSRKETVPLLLHTAVTSIRGRPKLPEVGMQCRKRLITTWRLGQNYVIREVPLLTNVTYVLLPCYSPSPLTKGWLITCLVNKVKLLNSPRIAHYSLLRTLCHTLSQCQSGWGHTAARNNKKGIVEKPCFLPEVADYRQVECKLKSSRPKLSMFFVVSLHRALLYHSLHHPLMGSS